MNFNQCPHWTNVTLPSCPFSGPLGLLAEPSSFFPFFLESNFSLNSFQSCNLHHGCPKGCTGGRVGEGLALPLHPAFRGAGVHVICPIREVTTLQTVFNKHRLLGLMLGYPCFDFSLFFLLSNISSCLQTTYAPRLD